jgi:D-sedoheptulose 7-phosphate isomerase
LLCPRSARSHALSAGTSDPLIPEEVVEMCHTLRETIHVFPEHRELGFETGIVGADRKLAE